METLASLSPEKIENLRDFFDSSDFRLRYRFYVAVAELLGISNEAAAKLCTFINYVQAQRTKNNQSAAAVIEELERYLEQVAVEPVSKEEARRALEQIRSQKLPLTRLFSDLPEYDFSEKVRGLESGPIPHLHSFRAFCDLRPVYDQDANEIVSCFPVITIRLVTHNSGTDVYQDFLVQMTEDDLGEFKKQFDRLEKKLERLKGRGPMLITQSGKLAPKQRIRRVLG